MERIFAIVAVGAFLASPAFAQQAPKARDQDWASRVHVYGPDYYVPEHQSRIPNPEYRFAPGNQRRR